MRTTVDIATPILHDLKKLQKEEQKSLGDLVSELLAQALAARARTTRRPPFRWHTASLGRALVDLDDKEAVWSALDEEQGHGRRR